MIRGLRSFLKSTRDVEGRRLYAKS